MYMVKYLYQVKKKKKETSKGDREKQLEPHIPKTFFKTHMESLKLHLYQINLGGLSVIKHAERVPIKS